MALRFYEFHFAEGNGSELKNLGILFYRTDKPLNREDLISYTRKIIENPTAVITISHITKLNKEEYDKLTSKNSPA